MIQTLEMTGTTRDEAIEKALLQLGKDRDDVSVEVLDNGKKGIFGFGATPAKVLISYEVPDEAPKKVQPTQPIKKQEEKSMPEKPKNEEAKAQKISITTEDTTPRLVKPAPSKTEKPVELKQKPERKPRSRRNRDERPMKPSVPKERELVAVSEACMKQAETLAAEFIDGLLQKMGVEGKVTTLPQLEVDQLRVSIEGPDMGPVIGRRGDTLDAIQYLTGLVLNNALDEHVRISVDTENYRAKRAESLEKLARKMALKVQKNHRSMTLEPMNPYERRIIHATLQEFNGIITYSTGTEPNRRIVIAPDNRRNHS